MLIAAAVSLVDRWDVRKNRRLEPWDVRSLRKRNALRGVGSQHQDTFKGEAPIRSLVLALVFILLLTNSSLAAPNKPPTRIPRSKCAPNPGLSAAECHGLATACSRDWKVQMTFVGSGCGARDGGCQCGGTPYW